MINKELLAKHRAKTKKQILEKLKTCDRFGVVRPVGYGKSYIMTELCKELPGKKLIFEPRDEIINYVKDFGKAENTDAITYHNLLSKKFDHESLLEYDYIFLDEMHRALAEKWGKVLKEDLKEYKGKIVGFSATPERTDLKNPIDEIFDGEQIEPLYLVDAIKQNILPQITYVTSIYEIDKKFYKNEALKKQLEKYNITNNLKNIFNEYLNFNKPLHILVFNSNIKDIQQNIKYISSWIDRPINIYECYHTVNDKILTENINSFINSTSGINIMFCVNMFNEGIHLKNLDAVIFLRKTTSNIIYNQQLGRLISEYNDNAVVFDLVNNAYYLDTGYLSIWANEAKERKCKVEDIELDNKEKLKIHKKQEDIINLLLSSERIKTCLSEEEKQYIEENRMIKTIREISEDLNKKYQTIFYYLKNNNLDYKYIGNILLTEEEKQYIEENRLIKTISEIAKGLNRPISTTPIINYLKKNNLDYKNANKLIFLTEEEKQYIEENRLIKSVPEIAKCLNRSETTIRNYLQKYNLDYSSRRHLSEREKQYIEENRRTKHLTEIAKDLHRSIATIRNYLNSNSLKYIGTKYYDNLSEEEKQYIEENRLIKTIPKIAKDLNRAASTVRHYLKNNNLDYICKSNYLSEREKQYIEENRMVKTISEIVKDLNRSEATVRNYLKSNNLKYKPNSNLFSEEEKQYIKNNINIKTITEIAKDLNRSRSSVSFNLKDMDDKFKFRLSTPRRRLSEEEKQYIEENRLIKTTTQIAKDLNRSQHAVKNYLIGKNLNYKSIREITILSEEEKQYIEENRLIKPITEIAKDLNKDFSTIKRYLDMNNLDYKGKRKEKDDK